MKTKFSKTDLGCVIGDEWVILGNRIRESDDGLYLTGNGEPEKVLPFPFTLEQFRAFCERRPDFLWEAIESVFTNDDGSLDDAAIDRLSRTSGAADLVRAILAAHDAEFQKAWGIHEQIDLCKAKIQRWERLEQNAPTPSEAITAEHKLAGLRAELAGLLSQLSGTGQEHPQATTSQPPAAPNPAPASTEQVEPEQAAPAMQPRAMKRCALIDECLNEWSSIEGDLREASRNGLDSAKLLKHGMWDADKALTWAKSHGKLTKQKTGMEPATWCGSVIRHQSR